ncbi:MAG: nucleoside hydrolase [Lactobacillaceae bacterium]
MRKIIIDTDTGSDDAVALAMAMKQKDLDILGITTVAGNCEVYQATKNALMTAEHCESHTPIFKGCSDPIFRSERIDAVQVHGTDGMGDLGLINPKAHEKKMHAVDFIIDTVKNNPNEVEIITIGPLTNIALAIAKEPQIMEKVKHYYIMGTSGLGLGNASSVSEFNIYADAESFDILLRRSQVKKTIIGFDVCIENYLNREEITAISEKNALGKFLMDANHTLINYNIQRMNNYILDLPDAIAVAVAIWPDIILESKEYYATCCCDDIQTYGQVIFNDRTDSLAIEHNYPADNVSLIRKINKKLFKQMLYDAL